MSKTTSKLAQSSYSLWNQHKESGLANRGSNYGYAVELFVEIEGFNPRDYDAPETIAHIRSLADSYKRGDTLPPLMIKVVDGIPYVWDGHCRLRGAKLAISEGAPLKFLDTQEMTGDEIAQQMTVLKTKEGLPLKPLEIAVMISRLVKLMGSEEAVASALNKSRTYVVQHMEMHNLPLDLKELIRSDVVAWSTVVDTVRDHGVAKAYTMIKSAIDKKEKRLEVIPVADAAAEEVGSNEPVVAEVAPKKAPVRIRRADILSQSGYRSSFSKNLVMKVTDGINMLGAKIAATEDGQGAQLTLSAEELAILRQLIDDVKPKAAEPIDASQKVAEEPVVSETQGSLEFCDNAEVSAAA